ncbi:four-carbon acid sugar kinase family protein [Caballeronia sp. LP003]|uniref:four-carbon acid sugar kinase family protein n=1 Tax=Caballeronia sp. LP003 TaxID=3038551 RepID=UPI002854279C|nr:four-carbon acid sugar kinase family protein [Caballeronia sp. LP003]MDR5785446.1 four-carbon acid sugar kinase family protein [Caballeronia sp. LP003]
MTAAPYGFYGDDFTGATDTLANLARAGLRAMLFVEAPTPARLATLGPLDAIGMAGAARTLTPEAMRAELARIGALFAALGVRVMHYKVCSTFDSAQGVGNIAVAIDCLRGHFGNALVPIVGGQPNLGRYCAFGNLFATAGGAQVHRIDRHPAMSCHPVTPMLEADLRLHFERLGVGVNSLDWRAYALPDAALNDAIDSLLGAPVLFDVLDDTHLLRVGRVMHQRSARTPMLAVGASSVAQAWAMTAAGQRELSVSPALKAAQSPVFVLAGSLSPMTEQQIEAAHSYQRVELDPCAMHVAPYRRERRAKITDGLRAGRHVLAYTRRTPVEISADASPLATNCAELLRDVVADARPGRIGIAGGDTSSFSVQALRPWGLSYVATLSTGVTICRVHSDDTDTHGLELMLKGGQMGGVDCFERLVREFG